MLYQFDRPFQARPLYFQLLGDGKLDALLPRWFGPAWQQIPSDLRASVTPDLTLHTEDPLTLNRLEDYIYEHVDVDPDFFVFHGGAVSKDDKAFLFLASTTTGKTTLMTYLWQSGYELWNDDSVGVRMTDGKMIPFQSPVHLREGGLTYLRSVLPTLPEPVEIYSADMPRFVLSPFTEEPSHLQPAPISRVFVLNRVKEPLECASCEKLPAHEALQMLLTGALLPYAPTFTHIRFCQGLATRTYRLTYHDAAQVLPILEEASHDIR